MAPRVQSTKAKLRPYDPRQNLMPNRPGEERRGGRQTGVPNKINRMLKETSIEGINEAGDYLLAKAEIEEQEAYEQLVENGATQEELDRFWRRAKRMRTQLGGAAGWFAWVAIQDPAALLVFLKGILPIQMRDTTPPSSSVSHTETSEDGRTRTTVSQTSRGLTLAEMAEQLRERGIDLPMIDVSPPALKNAVADPNPMVEGTGEPREIDRGEE